MDNNTKEIDNNTKGATRYGIRQQGFWGGGSQLRTRQTTGHRKHGRRQFKRVRVIYIFSRVRNGTRKIQIWIFCESASKPFPIQRWVHTFGLPCRCYPNGGTPVDCVPLSTPCPSKSSKGCVASWLGRRRGCWLPTPQKQHSRLETFPNSLVVAQCHKSPSRHFLQTAAAMASSKLRYACTLDGVVVVVARPGSDSFLSQTHVFLFYTVRFMHVFQHNFCKQSQSNAKNYCRR